MYLLKSLRRYGNANALAGGISEVIDYRSRPIVAIPALVMHRYFTGLVESLVVSLEREAIKLVMRCKWSAAGILRMKFKRQRKSLCG